MPKIGIFIPIPHTAAFQKIEYYSIFTNDCALGGQEYQILHKNRLTFGRFYAIIGATMAGRPKNTRILPYRLLCILLYGKMDWLARDGYAVTAPVGVLANCLKTRPHRLQEYVYALEDWGLVETARYNPHWVQVQLKTPVGMQWKVEPQIQYTYIDESLANIDPQVLEDALDAARGSMITTFTPKEK